MKNLIKDRITVTPDFTSFLAIANIWFVLLFIMMGILEVSSQIQNLNLTIHNECRALQKD